MGELRGRGVEVVLLALVWVALWGDLSVGNVLGGLAVGLLVIVGAPARRPRRRRPFRPGPWLAYGMHFVRELVIATWQVVVQVLGPPSALVPGVVLVRLRTADEGLVSLVADTITLTPGTLTLEVDPPRGLLWVHALHLPDDEAVRAVLDGASAFEERGARMLGVELAAGPVTPAERGGGAR